MDESSQVLNEPTWKSASSFSALAFLSASTSASVLPSLLAALSRDCGGSDLACCSPSAERRFAAPLRSSRCEEPPLRRCSNLSLSGVGVLRECLRVFKKWLG